MPEIFVNMPILDRAAVAWNFTFWASFGRSEGCCSLDHAVYQGLDLEVLGTYGNSDFQLRESAVTALGWRRVRV